jgi:hypothetical protein
MVGLLLYMRILIVRLQKGLNPTFVSARKESQLLHICMIKSSRMPFEHTLYTTVIQSSPGILLPEELAIQ